jgi:hypothetical protein
LTALELLDDPHALYTSGNETVRSILNRALFTRLYVDGGRVTGQELHEPFDMLHEAYVIYRERQADRRSRWGERSRTYHRRGAGSALTGELTATTARQDEAAWRQLLHTASSADLLTETGATSQNNLTEALALVLADVGSSTPVVVGVAGFEPTASSSRTAGRVVNGGYLRSSLAGGGRCRSVLVGGVAVFRSCTAALGWDWSWTGETD